MDTRSPHQRRRIMQSVGTANTGPEWVVRRLLHSNGYRYRLHVKRLPGKPDIVFPSRKKAIFVHGCFWHGHGCPKGQPPKSRLDYWGPKLEANRARDERNLAELRLSGWRVLVVWQCETKCPDALLARLKTFVDGTQNPIDSASDLA
jgi:DNA mismatch endonuclease, patch repair protein